MDIPEQENSIAVCYLARVSENLMEIRAFLYSYLVYQPEIEHDLLLIVKGKSGDSDVKLFQAMIEEYGISAEIYWVDDSIGFDIHAYQNIFEKFKASYNYFMFLKTSSLILCPNWLNSYVGAFSNPKIGLVGATGSFESLQSSWHAILNAQNNFFNGNLKYRETLKWTWVLTHKKSKKRLFILNVYFRLKNICRRFLLKVFIGNSPQETSTDQLYASVTSLGGDFNFLKNFPLFPNPHIRTTAFMIKSRVLDQIKFDLGVERNSVAEFESGRNSLTNQILRMGLQPAVVDNSGKTYMKDEWGTSKTFRNEQQQNLLISDNRTSDYTNMPSKTRRLHEQITWGSESKIMGVNFKIPENTNTLLEQKSKFPSISVVIPSHNGNARIRETTQTVLKQNYQDLEVIIFDNSSKTPLAHELAEISETRLKIFRSEDFLPVTESWNRALEHASGDYVMLFGDDDGLAPNFSHDVLKIFCDFGQPDLIYSNLYQFIYPQVKTDSSQPELRFHPVAKRLDDLKYPEYLSTEERMSLVKNSLALKRNFFYNMPSFIIKQTLLRELRENEKFLLGPFPDYYIANLLMAKAKSCLIVPKPLSFQGISKKSFGHSLLTNTTHQGFIRLGQDSNLDEIREIFSRVQLGDSRYVDEFVLTMMQVCKVLGDREFAVDFKRYRQITIFNKIISLLRGSGNQSKVAALRYVIFGLRTLRNLRITEYIFIGKVLAVLILASRFPKQLGWLYSDIQQNLKIFQYSPFVKEYPIPFVSSPLGIYEQIANLELD